MSDAQTPAVTLARQLKRRACHPDLYQQALSAGLTELQARVLAGRLSSPRAPIEALVRPGLKYIHHPEKLRDARLAAERIAQAVSAGEHIGILTDYDVDGITSHVVILRTLNELFGVPRERLHSLIGHRIHDGYGISQPLVERTLALSPRPGLVISADCGSSDEPRIAQLARAGIDVVVTDHHALPVEGPPPSALAVVNPSRSDCSYPDATIAGCMVSWLLMSLARAVLIEQGILGSDTPKLSPWLSYVALGTVADCVSLGDSAINRAVVTQGLSLINRMGAPCWRMMAERLGADSTPFDAETLAFQMGPRINARSRLDDPYAALHFMLADNDTVARRYLDLLDQDNQARKAIEQTMVETARAQVQPALMAGARVLVTFLEQGHPGVQGIVASRLVQAWGRPTFVLTPAEEDGMLTGSGRSVEGVHLRDALQRAFALAPDALPRFGGHGGAAGIGLAREQLGAFETAIAQAIEEQLGERELYPLLLTDGELDASCMGLALLDELEALAPYGREFDPPLFEGVFQVDMARLVGSEGNHLMLTLEAGRQLTRAIWFRAVDPGDPSPVSEGDQVRCAFKLSRNRYRGRESLQLMIEHLEPA
ncbi:single-stranded-DNA-specific exonuclease RecJ [Larsenimonas rhizosphaerae]|uniref:Single-stranded-DNA-specific exonuclease RecJ n=1 Tax=Larsenimonas rhizosphaerae TaxID=2944682 RepID=A0AA41ZPT9_9GAMM|nr:single-stranded-DNA-specific exonuclease RecJ [Larsenimonas rhizosphaerae]MCX2525030.1 single-stranded-DNA-specific exonuclease RecJ [Larsenimonas rhizosphaerae]